MSSGFIGKFQYTIDEKGRINIPSKFRRCLGPEAEDTMVVTRGSENGLFAYPLDVWKKIIERINLKPQTPENTIFRRFFLDTSSDSTLDKQGRIRLTPDQVAFAKIEKDVIIVGDIDKIGIWNPKQYNEKFEKTPENASFDDYYYAVMKNINQQNNAGE